MTTCRRSPGLTATPGSTTCDPVDRYRSHERSSWCSGFPLPAFAGTSFAGMTYGGYHVPRLQPEDASVQTDSACDADKLTRRSSRRADERRRKPERAEMLIHVVAKRPMVRFGLTSPRSSAKMR